MFVAKSQEAYLKGFKNVEAGTFTAKDGSVVPYDAFHQVTLSVFNKNDELIDVKCRIPNTSEGDALYRQLKDTKLMSKLLVDVEAQISATGSTRFFIIGFAEAQ